MKPYRCGGALLLLASIAGWSQNASPNAYVGTDICLRCHIDFARRWAALDHSQAMLADSLPPERKGCEACHGPGGEHVAGRRKQIVRWEPLSTEERTATCLKCHEHKVDPQQWADRTHAELLSCDVCHEVHKPTKRAPMLRADEEGVECAECHDMEAEVTAGRHHSLADGALPCNMCHAFHGSPNEFLLTQPLDKKLCDECHEGDDMRPESHRHEGFRLGHREEAKGHEAECHRCHSQANFCDRCHVVKLPHAEDYPVTHAEDAKRNGKACRQCHEEAFCKLCHEEVPQSEGATEGQAEP